MQKQDLSAGRVRCQRLAISLFANLLLLMLFSCEIDHGLEPIRTRITGKVIFDKPPTGSNISEIRVVAAKTFPPVNLTTDIILSDKLDLQQDTLSNGTVETPFEIVAPSGIYPAVGVLWREAGQSWELTNILGLYTQGLDFSPIEITLDEENPVVDDIVINAITSFTKRTAFIEGTITTKGTWPADTDLLALAVFPIVPNPANSLDFIQLQAFDITIPIFRDTPFSFRTRVPADTYPFISVFWKGKSGGLLDIRAVGFYSCGSDSTLPGTITVPENTTISGIDITIDLDSLPSGVRYQLESELCTN